jgi:hypothetical protein
LYFHCYDVVVIPLKFRNGALDLKPDLAVVKAKKCFAGAVCLRKPFQKADEIYVVISDLIGIQLENRKSQGSITRKRE